MKVFLPRVPGDDFLRILRAQTDPRIEFILGPDLPETPDYEWLVEGTPSREQVEASPRLRGVIVPWAGIPPGTAGLLRDRTDLLLHNLHHNAAATAELAIALLLAAARRIVPVDRALRSGDWTPGWVTEGDWLLEGRTAVILGYGEIGKRIARICHAFGMYVIGVRRADSAGGRDGFAGELVGVSQLGDVLPRAQILFVALPLTPETEGLLGPEALTRLPEKALLVNVGRGPIVDENALYEGLRTGRIGAAGLDVWYRYPRGGNDPKSTLPGERPFHELDNVVLSPHRAGSTSETEPLRAHALAELLSAAARGEALPHPVDLTRGY